MKQSPVLFDHVWKKFRRGERHDSLRDFVPALARRALGRAKPEALNETTEFWALHDVSFALEPGEAFGIIGQNGAGKSTTLKLLTKILRPTRGTCHVRGRVGALIEVAAGFHPDLTGRENIFLQGAIMGMKRRDIRLRMDEIIQFANIEEFIDTQVKRYSSGMNARLGFSIAVHLNPDVLIIDEVLAVGDMAFQQRCVARMLEFKRQGVTIVFVSHNLEAVSRLCDRALLLNRSVRAIGETEAVIDEYTKITGTTEATSSDEARISVAALVDASGSPVTETSPGQRLRLRVTYELGARGQDLQFTFVIYRSTDNTVVYQQGVTQEELGLGALTRGDVTIVDFAFSANLLRGHYYVELVVKHPPSRRVLANLRPAATFHVREFVSSHGVAFLDMQASVVSPARESYTVAPAP